MFSYPQVVDNFVNKRKRYEMMTNIKPHGPLPSQAQLDYLEDELAAFIHFGPNTFYDQEWGSGQEDPKRFNPTKLDAREWIRVLKETGFKKLILCSIRQPIQIIRSRLALGGKERGTCSLKYPRLQLSLTWIWECICLLGMLTVPSITWTEKRITMPTIWLN